MKTYAEILTGNISAARARLKLSQRDTVDRMRALGFTGWHPPTMGNVERGERSLRADEILGLAACLETTVLNLMSPLPQDGPVEIGSGLGLSFGQVRSLLFGHGPNDDDPRSSVVAPRDLRGIRWTGNALEAADQ